MRHAVAAILLLFAVPALGSTDAAMDKGMKQAVRSCLKVSNLRDAAIVGSPILFSDNSGKTAILVSGRWRPAHMKGARTTMLCLYDRATRMAEAQEAPRWGLAAQ